MNAQTSIDFTATRHNTYDHGAENNAQSERHYEANLDRFNNHCRKILERLLRGERLTTARQMEYGTGDLRARVRDLRNAGIPVQDDFVTTEDGKRTRFKYYYL